MFRSLSPGRAFSAINFTGILQFLNVFNYVVTYLLLYTILYMISENYHVFSYNTRVSAW
jgi:hypothetical protein